MMITLVYFLRSFFWISLCLLPMHSHALTSVDFVSGDWQLICDNTRTCRAAGYQKDEDSDSAISVLLTRKAGPNQSVLGQVMLGMYEEKDMENVALASPLIFMINGKPVGKSIDFRKKDTADLSVEQVGALLAAMTKQSDIQVVGKKLRYRLSDKGAAAVLLKMDEFQGRLDTVGALFKKGQKNEENVLAALPKPVVDAVMPTESTVEANKQFVEKNKVALMAALRQTLDDEECPMAKDGRGELSAERLTDDKMLVSMPCWLGAYNSSANFWVINSTPPFTPVFVTESGSFYVKGEIFASHKGRGLGDCWFLETWTWNGKQFIHTAESSTGLCKLIAAGGAWDLPIYISDVKRKGVEPTTPQQ